MPFFILGSHPTLSIAEIATVLGKQKYYAKSSREILLLDEVEIPLEVLQERLAGTVKIGEVLKEIKNFKQNELADFLFSLLPKTESKVVFGLSVYSSGAPIGQLLKEVKGLGMAIKKRLKENGQSARFVSVNTPALTTAAVTGENILTSGGEFVLIAAPGKILIGQTRTVQDFRSWSDRDYGRPARDTKSGMLPPKLARMMINLSGAKTTNTILDPFCGSGTVLMEAALMGFTKIIGSDISAKAVQDTKINLDWLAQNFKIDVSAIKLFTRPVETLQEIWKEKSDAVVAEIYLGPPLSGRESPANIKQIINELTEYTISSLKAVRRLLKNSSTAVLALPVFQTPQKIEFLPTVKLVEAAGLKIVDVLPDSLPRELKIKTPAGGFLYARKEQRIGREILILKA